MLARGKQKPRRRRRRHAFCTLRLSPPGISSATILRMVPASVTFSRVGAIDAASPAPTPPSLRYGEVCHVACKTEWQKTRPPTRKTCRSVTPFAKCGCLNFSLGWHSLIAPTRWHRHPLAPDIITAEAIYDKYKTILYVITVLYYHTFI